MPVKLLGLGIVVLILCLLVVIWFAGRTRIRGAKMGDDTYITQCVSCLQVGNEQVIKVEVSIKGDLTSSVFLRARVPSDARNLHILRVEGNWVLVDDVTGKIFPAEPY